jgi:hypothetical protein
VNTEVFAPRANWWSRNGSLVGLGIVLVVALVITIYFTTRKSATHVETALWEFISFAIGLGLSYYLGKASIKQAANDVIKPQARSALRRLSGVGSGIATAQQYAQGQAERAMLADDWPAERFVDSLETMSLMLSVQIESLSAAIEDWREFSPELVNELEVKAKLR